MREGRASRTAEYNALFRALESARPEKSRLFEDSLARAFLGWPLSLVERLGRVPGLREVLTRYIDQRWPGPRTAVVARTRLIDDALAEEMGPRIGQMVILGAGFDTRAYRLPGLARVAVFEVDHPSTQDAKRRALERALPLLPERVRFVASDFTRQDLRARMAAAGYRESLPALILWEGVTNYLTESSVDATLRWCSDAAPGSLLLFTYVHSDILTRPETFVGSKRLFHSLERAGERFTFGIHPDRLAQFLSERGLVLAWDLGAAEFRARTFGEAARRMRGHEFYRVALARVDAH